MKMKEVCAATGLTERAVRFYVQEGLVAPTAQRRNGRTWLDFSPADVERLDAVATLRRVGFTLEEIRTMEYDFSSGAPKAAFALRRRLEEQIAAYEKLCRADPAGAADLEEFARQFRLEAVDRPLPESDQMPAWRPWEDWVEWGCMGLAAILGWKIYMALYTPLDVALFSLGLSALSVLLLPLLYLAVALPISLVLGHKVGRWLAKHLDF